MGIEFDISGISGAKDAVAHTILEAAAVAAENFVAAFAVRMANDHMDASDAAGKLGKAWGTFMSDALTAVGVAALGEPTVSVAAHAAPTLEDVAASYVAAKRRDQLCEALGCANPRGHGGPCDIG